jgi:tetratricopeptide (TPR) repeat protein
MGLPTGLDLLGFDEQGKALPTLALGVGEANLALALLDVPPETKRVYLYFGSGGEAPQSSWFKPSLTVDIRTFAKGGVGSRSEVGDALQKSQRLGRVFVDTISLSYNPIDSSDRMLMVFRGYLRVESSGPQTFMLVSDDAGYLFIDEKLVLERKGHQRVRDMVRGECRQTVELTAGLHPIRCLVADSGGGQMAVVARWKGPRDKAVLSKDDFLQPGQTKLLSVEPRHSEQGCPSFEYQALSYMSVDGIQFTEVKFRTLNGRPARWKFSDGAVFQSASFRHVLVGVKTRGVALDQDGAKASGRVAFPGNPPERQRMWRYHEFNNYAELMRQQDPQRLETQTLLGYWKFLRYRELNQDLLPVCKVLLAGRKLKASTQCQVLLDLARAAGAKEPEVAKRAYASLTDGRGTRREWQVWAREFAEFTMLRLQDATLAEKIIADLGKELPPRHRLLALLNFELALLKKEPETARKYLTQLLEARKLVTKQRYAATRSNALRQEMESLIKKGFVDRAFTILHDWEELASEDWTNGNLALSRAHLWSKLGWWQGALTELEGAISLNPLLPNLPDVKLEQNAILRRLGRWAEAAEIARQIVDEFPNHPAAKTAAKRL